MNSGTVPDHATKASATSHATPVVFVVDDDVSMRESLKLLIRFAGWAPETFEAAQEFLSRPRVLVPSCLILHVALLGLKGLRPSAIAMQRQGCANNGHSPTAWRTGQIDPLLPFLVALGTEGMRTITASSRCSARLRSRRLGDGPHRPEWGEARLRGAPREGLESAPKRTPRRLVQLLALGMPSAGKSLRRSPGLIPRAGSWPPSRAYEGRLGKDRSRLPKPASIARGNALHHSKRKCPIGYLQFDGDVPAAGRRR